MQLRKSRDRGHADHGWLESRHTFSFADYYDPRMMGFKSLRVINEDRIAGGRGFGMHPHRDMEIITYVIRGALRHKDSMGNSSPILPGEVQYMSAAKGVTHSEFNESPHEETHLLQIWIMPESRGGEPTYNQKSFQEALNKNPSVLVVSKDGREGSIRIKQDADIHASRLAQGRELNFDLRPGRAAWVQLIKGRIAVNGEELEAGDALAAAEEPALKIQARKDSEFLLFDLT